MIVSNDIIKNIVEWQSGNAAVSKTVAPLGAVSSILTSTAKFFENKFLFMLNKHKWKTSEDTLKNS